MTLKLNDWKKVDGPESLEKGVANRHRENEAAREEVRQQGNKITEAFRKISLGRPRENVSSSKSDSQAPQILTSTANQAPPKKVEPLVVSNEPVAPKAKIENAVAPKEVVRTDAPTNKNVPTNALQNSAASSFVVGPKQAPLTDLLLRGSNVPRTPPQDVAERVVVQNDPRFQAQDGKNLPKDGKVVAPLAVPDGAQTANATLKQERSNAERGRKDGKKREVSRGTQGKGGIANHESRTTNDMSLRAAASGVASDPEKEVANLAGINFITQDPQNVGLHAVLARERLWNKILQLDRLSNREIADIEAQLRANPDPELQRILKLGLAARKNVNGGMNA